MSKQLECTKIIDGLYLGNFKSAENAQFLVTNKFTHIVNCSSEVPNCYQGQGIRYLKFKLVKDKPHRLWVKSLKKLNKLQKFIKDCQQNSQCCLIHSFDGVNRSLFMLVAFMMNRYRWRLGKTLKFIRSKDIFIGLSEHYIEELEKLQQILSSSEPNLTEEWRIDYKSEQQQIISKTFLNSQQIQPQGVVVANKKQKRVVWFDQAKKENKKQHKDQLKLPLQEQRILSSKPMSSQSMGSSLHANLGNGLKIEKGGVASKTKVKSEDGKENRRLPSGVQKLKIKGNKSKAQILIQEEENVKSKTSLRQKSFACSNPNLNSQEILNLIRKNLKLKKKPEMEGNNESLEKVYNVTINNFIKPNINITNKVVGDKNNKKRPKSAARRSAI